MAVINLSVELIYAESARVIYKLTSNSKQHITLIFQHISNVFSYHRNVQKVGGLTSNYSFNIYLTSQMDRLFQ